MPTLYSYCIPYDDGAAPNPFWGFCTLAICKPAIRRTASVGDWIVGTGSKNAPTGDLSGKLVYAMRITKVMSIQAYDIWARRYCRRKIPDWAHKDVKHRLGDCIYDYSTGKPRQRKGVHKHMNRETDLSGKNVLLSDHFYYFGKNAIDLPRGISKIVHQTQGHKSTANQPYFKKFVEWIENSKYEVGKLYGEPGMKVDFCDCGGCVKRLKDRDKEVVC